MTRRYVSPKQSLQEILTQQLEYLATASAMRPLTKEELRVLEVLMKLIPNVDLNGVIDVSPEAKQLSSAELTRLLNK
jgi:hypothetical protein